MFGTANATVDYECHQPALLLEHKLRSGMRHPHCRTLKMGWTPVRWVGNTIHEIYLETETRMGKIKTYCPYDGLVMAQSYHSFLK